MDKESKNQRNKNIKTALVLWAIVLLIVGLFFNTHWDECITAKSSSVKEIADTCCGNVCIWLRNDSILQADL